MEVKKIESSKNKEFYEYQLNEQKKIIENELFHLVKQKLIDLFKKNKEQNIDIKLIIKELENIKNNIIKYREQIIFKGKKVAGITEFKNNSKSIILSEEYIRNQNFSGIELLIEHELNHFIGRDKLNLIYLKKNYWKNPRELATKIITIRSLMKSKKYSLSIKGINKLFFDWELEEMKNVFSSVEEKEIDYIYSLFKNNKKDLLFYLQNLVKLEELKNEVHYA